MVRAGGAGGKVPDDMTSNASYMVKGNMRVDDLSSQGSFIRKADGGPQGARLESDGGSMFFKGGADDEKGSFGSDGASKAEFEDS